MSLNQEIGRQVLRAAKGGVPGDMGASRRLDPVGEFRKLCWNFELNHLNGDISIILRSELKETIGHLHTLYSIKNDK